MKRAQREAIVAAQEAWKGAQDRREDLGDQLSVAERNVERAHYSHEQWDAQSEIVRVESQIEEAELRVRVTRRELEQALEDAGIDTSELAAPQSRTP